MASPDPVRAGTTASQARSVCVIVPTRNGGIVWLAAAHALARAQQASAYLLDVTVVDSESTDDSADVARACGFCVHSVSPQQFDHGGTRNMVVQRFAAQADIVVFLTQDAVLASTNAIDTLVRAFDNPQVAVAYGRQLPQPDANPIAEHARLFNYGTTPRVNTLANAGESGIKAVFTSNSFSAYRGAVFRELGGFPERSILSEDMHFAARAVLAGHAVAYVPGAAVRHSHNYTPWEEFRRYFDIGVFHHDEAWIREKFGGAGGEGKRYLQSEWAWLRRQAPLWLPRAALHNALKILGYKLGQHYHLLPRSLRPRLSMHRKYWG